MEQESIGCFDGSCVFVPKAVRRRGVHTNGGCHCLEERIPLRGMPKVIFREYLMKAIEQAYEYGRQDALAEK